MPVIVHGEPGRSIQESHWGGPKAARRGAYFERVVASSLEAWLQARPDTTHLFHDVSDLTNIPGIGSLREMDLGATNIDHVVLSGSGWLCIDAKGCGAGTLRVIDGRGVLVGHEGQVRPQPWMDDASSYSRAGALFRLTRAKEGVLVWALPDDTAHDDPSIGSARFLSRGGMVLTPDDIRDGDLNQVFPVPQPLADTADVDRLAARLSKG